MSTQEIPGPRGATVSLDGAVAVVTGASSGIGLAVARALRDAGARVVVSSRRMELLEPVAKELDGLAVTCDVGDYRQVQALVAAAVDWGGKLTVMVNNAGYGVFGPLHEIDAERVEGMIRTNVLGVIYGMRAAGEQLVRQRQGGGIVNISSIVGEFPDPGSGAYAASKAAVDLLSRTGYRELRDHGIHVVNIKPALTDTEFSAVARGSTHRTGGDPPEKVARWVVDALESGSATAGYR
ncbi:MAG TPA: SDR family oxidoreductase [Gaiellales bacterium]|nr:SDR family oxidoreductase [Gaiellales bacterium]